MHRLNERGSMLLNSLQISHTTITQQMVEDILSLQNCIYPYTDLESREIRWIQPEKRTQGGHFSIAKLKKKYFTFEK